MRETVNSHRDLRVYRDALDAAMRVFEITKGFPADERFALVDQFRRSSRSVCANLAEAMWKRKYLAHFVSKLSDAEAGAAETEVHAEIALLCGYVDEGTARELYERYDRILGQLVRTHDHPEQWVIR